MLHCWGLYFSSHTKSRCGQLRAGAAAFRTPAVLLCHHPGHCGFHPCHPTPVASWSCDGCWLSSHLICVPGRAEGKTKGENDFFFFSGKTCFILRNTVPSLGLLPTFHWPEMSRVATLAIAESRTSGWLSSLYNRSGLRRRGSGKGWVNILACLPHSSPWLGWTVLEGTAPALSLGWGMNWWSEEWPSFLWKGGGFPGSKSSRPGAEQGSRRLNAAWIGEEMGQDSRTLSSQWAGRNVSFREKEGEEAGVFCDLSQGGAQSGYL